MSATIWMEMVCVHCACTDHGRHSRPSRATTEARAMVAEAHKNGWRDYGDWVCPPCVRKGLTFYRPAGPEPRP